MGKKGRGEGLVKTDSWRNIRRTWDSRESERNRLVILFGRGNVTWLLYPSLTFNSSSGGVIAGGEGVTGHQGVC